MKMEVYPSADTLRAKLCRSVYCKKRMGEEGAKGKEQERKREGTGEKKEGKEYVLRKKGRSRR
jgi:hypothetical protein